MWLWTHNRIYWTSQCATRTSLHWALTGYTWKASESSPQNDPLFWVALKLLLHKMQIFFFFFLSWHCKGDIVSHFLSLCVLSSSRFASLHLSFLPLPTLVCPLGISSEHSPPFFFSIRVMDGGGIEREYDEEGMRYCTEAVTLTESTEQCTREIGSGATAGEHWFVSCFVLGFFFVSGSMQGDLSA